MANGDIDIQEELRKKQLSQDLMSRYMPSMTPQPTTQPAQPQQPDLAQQDIDRMRAYQPPPTAGLEKSATDYAEPLHKPTYGEYKMNKPLAIALGVLGMRNWMRDPVGEIKSINEIARKGYRQAEEQYENVSADRERAFRVQSAVYNQRAAMYGSNVANAGNIASKQMELNRYHQETAMWPMQQQKLANDLLISTDQAKRLGQPTVGNEMVMVHTPEGDQLGYRRFYPPGSPIPFDFAMGDGKIVQPGKGVSFEPYQPEGKSTDDIMFNSAVKEWRKNNPDWVKNNPGIIAPQDVLGEIKSSVKKADIDPSEEARMRIQEAGISKRAEIAETHADQRETMHRVDIAVAAARREVDLKALNNQLNNLHGLETTLSVGIDPKSPNATAQFMAVTELVTSLASPTAKISRYNSKELADLRKVPGFLESLAAAGRNLLGGSPIPPKLLAQIKPLVDAQIKTMQEERNIGNQYYDDLANAMTESAVSQATRKYQKAMDNLYTPGSGQPSAKQLEDLINPKK